MSDMNVQDIGANIDQLLAEMEARTITTDEDYSYTAEWLKRNKGTQKIVDSVFDPQVKALREPYQAKLDEKKVFISRLEAGERIAKKKMGEYINEKERLAAEERRRIEAENKAKEDERRLNEAVETGDETILDGPSFAAPVDVPASPKIEGISYVETWKFEIVNPDMIPRKYLVVDEQAIRGVVRALKDKAEIPGIRVYVEKTVRAGAA